VLYGTTESGGDAGNGIVFKVNTDGTGYTVLKSFPALVPASFGTNSDGSKPTSDLVLDGNTLYGTTSGGGDAGNGTVFSLNTDGSDFTILKSFSPTFLGTNNVSGNPLAHGTNSDGAQPIAGLVLSGSTLYGTTFYGGSSNGVIFKVDTDGSDFAVIKQFPPLLNGTNSDGANARAGLTLNGDELYGATVNGGSLYDGTLFKLKTNGTGFVVLKHYLMADGAFPNTPPALSGHTLYGIAFAGGAAGDGTLYKVNVDGSGYAVFKSLDSASGFYAYSRLVSDGSTLYGTTYYGGGHYNGVVFAFGIPPEIQVADGGFGIHSNVFGFNVSGGSNQTVVIEASFDLAGGNWIPLQTNVLGSTSFHFEDNGWTNYPRRFYRARSF
jgi:uncharacterized repeat protein (TIGR03803 family)